MHIVSLRKLGLYSFSNDFKWYVLICSAELFCLLEYCLYIHILDFVWAQYVVRDDQIFVKKKKKQKLTTQCSEIFGCTEFSGAVIIKLNTRKMEDCGCVKWLAYMTGNAETWVQFSAASD